MLPSKNTPFFHAFAIYFISAWLGVLPANAETLPNLGSSDLVEYTPEKEEELGRAFKAALHSEYAVISDADIHDYIRRIGHKIAQHTGQNRDFSFYVIDEPSINAFAGPDGVIGLHTGLIRAVRSEDELASVIAHEIAHVTQNHLSRRYEAQSGSSLASLASFIAAVLVGSQNAEAGMAVLMGSMGASIQQQLKFSRAHESEADFAGIDYLYKSGYNPFAMGDFFGRLAQEYRHNEFKPLEILLTHPVTEHRLAEAKNRAHQFPPLIFKHDDTTLQLIKRKLQAISGMTDETLPASTNRAESCYQQSLELSASPLLKQPAKIEQSLHCLEDAISDHPTQRLYQTRLLEVANLQSKPSTKILQQASATLELFPQDSAALIGQAKLLANLQKTDEAISLLERKTPALRYQYEPLKLLASLYQKRGKTAHAYFAEAKAYFNIGHLKRTQIYLKNAETFSALEDRALKQKITLFKLENAKLLKDKRKEQP